MTRAGVLKMLEKLTNESVLDVTTCSGKSSLPRSPRLRSQEEKAAQSHGSTARRQIQKKTKVANAAADAIDEKFGKLKVMVFSVSLNSNVEWTFEFNSA